jgi:RNA polymerase sigma factor (sigma-70 family)
VPCAPLPQEPLAEREIAAAKRAVAALLGHRTQVGGNDADDIVQMVLERWTRHLGRFDETGAASMETYIWKVAKNLLRDLVRREGAQKRGGGREPLSVDRPLGEGSDTTLGDLVPDPSQTETLGEAVDHALLRRAIARFRDHLPPLDRAIFDAFVAEPRPRAVADRLGLPPSTVYGWLGRLRRQAEDAGLRKFLE